MCWGRFPNEYSMPKNNACPLYIDFTVTLLIQQLYHCAGFVFLPTSWNIRAALS